MPRIETVKVEAVGKVRGVGRMSAWTAVSEWRG